MEKIFQSMYEAEKDPHKLALNVISCLSEATSKMTDKEFVKSFLEAVESGFKHRIREVK